MNAPARITADPFDRIIRAADDCRKAGTDPTDYARLMSDIELLDAVASLLDLSASDLGEAKQTCIDTLRSEYSFDYEEGVSLDQYGDPIWSDRIAPRFDLLDQREMVR